MKVKALQAALRERNLPTTGKKEVLLSRLQASIGGEQLAKKPDKKKKEKKTHHIPPIPKIDLTETTYRNLELTRHPETQEDVQKSTEELMEEEGAAASGGEEGGRKGEGAAEPGLARCSRGEGGDADG